MTHSFPIYLGRSSWPVFILTPLAATARPKKNPTETKSNRNRTDEYPEAASLEFPKLKSGKHRARS